MFRRNVSRSSSFNTVLYPRAFSPSSDVWCLSRGTRECKRGFVSCSQSLCFLEWRSLNRPPAAFPLAAVPWLKSVWNKVKVILLSTASRPVFLGVSHPFGSYSCSFVDVGCPLSREDGSVVYNYYWSSPLQSFHGPSPAGLIIFYCLVFETSSTLKAMPHVYNPKMQWPIYTLRIACRLSWFSWFSLGSNCIANIISADVCIWWVCLCWCSHCGCILLLSCYVYIV